MSLIESADPQAREDIGRLKAEQYAQSERLKAAEELGIKHTEQISGIEGNFGRRFDDFDRRFQACDHKHEAANQHRRKSDNEMKLIADTLQQSLEVNKQIQETNVKNQETLTKLLSTVEAHAPTVERAKANHTWWDKSKELLIVIAIVYAGLHGAEDIAAYFK